MNIILFVNFDVWICSLFFDLSTRLLTDQLLLL